MRRTASLLVDCWGWDGLGCWARDDLGGAQVFVCMAAECLTGQFHFAVCIGVLCHHNRIGVDFSSAIAQDGFSFFAGRLSRLDIANGAARFRSAFRYLDLLTI